MSKSIVLGQNQYGKAEVRLVKVTRDTERHEIDDLNVTSQLRGDFDAAHTDGDNAHVVATDTQKNTVYAFARDGVGSPETFLLRLADHFTAEFEWITGGRGRPSSTRGRGSRSTARATTIPSSDRARTAKHPGHHRRRDRTWIVSGSATWWC